MKKCVVICLILLLVASVSLAGKKPGSSSGLVVDVDWGFDEPVSIFCVPDGSGNPLTTAFTFGGTVVDASLTVTLTSVNTEVRYVPAEDILLVPGGHQYYLCGEDGAVCGSGFTDNDGVMVLDGAIAGGGYAEPGFNSFIKVDTIIFENPMSGLSGPIPLYMNSADINGDGTVDLLDITLLSRDQNMLAKNGIYNYRSDFNWDGAIDETDTAMMSAAWGGRCE